MKKFLAVLLMTGLVLSLFAGCSKPAPAETAEPEAAEATTEAAAEETTDKEGILKLMGGSADFMKSGFSYDYVMTIGDQTSTSHFSFKGENVRMEVVQEENQSIMITKGKEMFIINPGEKTGFKMNVDESGEANAVNPAGDVKPEESMDKDNMKIIGKEDINGEPCYVVESKDMVGQYAMKMWIHQKYGIAMKMEAEAPEGKVMMEVKNLVVGDVPDSEFEIPSDIQIMEMPVMPQS